MPALPGRRPNSSIQIFTAASYGIFPFSPRLNYSYGDKEVRRIVARFKPTKGFESVEKHRNEICTGGFLSISLFSTPLDL